MNDMQKSPDLKQQAILKERLPSSEKSFVAIGERDGEKVIIKSLVSTEDMWVKKFQQERYILTAFRLHTLPFPVPEVFYEDADLIIMKYIEGDLLHTERYPDIAFSPEIISRLISLTFSFQQWQNYPDGLGAYNYAEKSGKYYKNNLLSLHEKDIITQHAHRHADAMVFNHGDFLLSNIMHSPTRGLIAIDWEFGGLFLPGFDLALLHTIFSADSNVQKLIEREVHREGIYGHFIINKAMVLTREIRIHHELPDHLDFKHKRLLLLEPAWKNLRILLKENL